MIVDRICYSGVGSPAPLFYEEILLFNKELRDGLVFDDV